MEFFYQILDLAFYKVKKLYTKLYKSTIKNFMKFKIINFYIFR